MNTENNFSLPKETLKVYCDGSVIGNPGKGGYAYVVLKDGAIVNETDGCFNLTTSPRMEIIALLKSMNWILNSILFRENQIDVIEFYSDSEYTVKSTSRSVGWIQDPKTDKANIDLWCMFHELQKQFHKKNILLSYNWVPGHSGNRWNEHVDKLAYTQASSDKGTPDVWYELAQKYKSTPYGKENPLEMNKLLFETKYIKQILNEK